MSLDESEPSGENFRFQSFGENEVEWLGAENRSEGWIQGLPLSVCSQHQQPRWLEPTLIELE